MVKISDIFNVEKGTLQSSKCTPGKYNFITASSEWKTHKDYTHECEALIIAVTASGSLGRVHYVNDKFISSDLCFILTPKKENSVYLKFYYHIFNKIRDDLVEKTATGSAKKAINRTNFSNYEIMHIDYEKQKELAEKLEHVNSNQSILLKQFENSHISSLKSKILDMAVRGELVEQDENDESAEILFEKIQLEKEKLAKEGKIKKQKPLPSISEDEIPYQIPANWKWCRLGDTSHNIHYGFNASANHEDLETRLLRITDIQNNLVNWNSVPGCKINDSELMRYKLNNSDILIARTGGTIGKSYIVQSLSVQAVFASYLIRLIPCINVYPLYIKYFVESPYYWEQLYSKTTGTGQPNVNASSLKGLSLPLPPLEEQKRIVEKVDKLMTLCNELEEKTKSTKELSSKLLDAVLNEALLNGE